MFLLPTFLFTRFKKPFDTMTSFSRHDSAPSMTTVENRNADFRVHPLLFLQTTFQFLQMTFQFLHTTFYTRTFYIRFCTRLFNFCIRLLHMFLWWRTEKALQDAYRSSWKCCPQKSFKKKEQYCMLYLGSSVTWVRKNSMWVTHAWAGGTPLLGASSPFPFLFLKSVHV